MTGFFIDTYYSAEKFYREARNAPDRIFASQEEFREHAHELFDAAMLYAPWNKLYRRSYLNEKNIRFPKRSGTISRSISMWCATSNEWAL